VNTVFPYPCPICRSTRSSRTPCRLSKIPLAGGSGSLRLLQR
jgi:hypothetical protein